MAMQRRVRWLALGCALVLATAAPALSEPRTIQVVEGDTLEQLALRYRVNLQALIELNGIRDPTLLQVGQVLLPVPAPRAGRVLRLRIAEGSVVGHGDALLDME